MPYLKIRFADETDPINSAKRKKELLRYISKSEEPADINDLIESARLDRGHGELTREDYQEILESAFVKRDELLSRMSSGIIKKAKELAAFLRNEYGGEAIAEKPNKGYGQVYAYVPGTLEREEFEAVLAPWCESHDCEYVLMNQTPQAPSPQIFSKGTKLMYPKADNYEALTNPKRAGDLKIAKALWQKHYNTEFDPNNPDDKKVIVTLFNEYMDELSKWKPVLIRIKQKEEQ